MVTRWSPIIFPFLCLYFVAYGCNLTSKELSLSQSFNATVEDGDVNSTQPDYDVLQYHSETSNATDANDTSSNQQGSDSTQNTTKAAGESDSHPEKRSPFYQALFLIELWFVSSLFPHLFVCYMTFVVPTSLFSNFKYRSILDPKRHPFVMSHVISIPIIFYLLVMLALRVSNLRMVVTVMLPSMFHVIVTNMAGWMFLMSSKYFTKYVKSGARTLSYVEVKVVRDCRYALLCLKASCVLYAFRYFMDNCVVRIESDLQIYARDFFEDVSDFCPEGILLTCSMIVVFAIDRKRSKFLLGFPPNPQLYFFLAYFLLFITWVFGVIVTMHKVWHLWPVFIGLSIAETILVCFLACILEVRRLARRKEARRRRRRRKTQALKNSSQTPPNPEVPKSET